MKTLAQPKVARVLFDESHSEAWTIRRELAEQMQPAHPEDSSYAHRRRQARPAATSTSSPTPTAPSPARPSPARTSSSSPTPPTPSGRRPPTPAARPSRDDELDALDEFVRGGGGLIVLRRDRAGQVRQQPERPPRPLRHRGRKRHRPGLRAQPQRPLLGARRPRRRLRERQRRRWRRRASTEGPHSVDLLARVHEACFYRSGTLALHNGGHVLARTFSTASPSGAPDRRRLAARRRAASSSSPTPTSSATTASASSTTRTSGSTSSTGPPQPAFGGLEPVTDSAAAADRQWAELKRGGRGAPRDPGAGRLGRPRKARGLPPCRAGRGDLQRRRRPRPPLPAPARLHRGPARRPRPLGDERLHQAGLHPLDRGLPPGADRRDGIEHLVVFPMYKQNASRDTCFEALIVRVPWPEFVADLEAARYDNPKFVPVNFVDYTVGLRLRVRRPLPGDVLHRRAPAELLRRASSATARPSASAASAAARPTSWTSTSRPTRPACSPRPSSRWTPTSCGT